MHDYRMIYREKTQWCSGSMLDSGPKGCRFNSVHGKAVYPSLPCPSDGDIKSHLQGKPSYERSYVILLIKIEYAGFSPFTGSQHVKLLVSGGLDTGK